MLWRPRMAVSEADCRKSSAFPKRCKGRYQRHHNQAPCPAVRHQAKNHGRLPTQCRSGCGLLGILFGIIAFLLPGVTMLSVILIFAGYILADGILTIVAAVRAARKHDRWGWLTFEGILSIITGIIAALWPGLTAVAFVLILAAWAIVTGGLMFAAALLPP